MDPNNIPIIPHHSPGAPSSPHHINMNLNQASVLGTQQQHQPPLLQYHHEQISQQQYHHDPPQTTTRATTNAYTAATSRKQTRDANAPKRNLSAYLLYQNAMRDTFKEQNPGMSFGQLSKYTSVMYSNLSEGEKEEWAAKAVADKNRYQAELESYVPPPGFDSKGDAIDSLTGRKKAGRKKGKTKRDTNAPKRNMSSYLLFQNAMRDQFKRENPEMTFGQLSKYTSLMYKSLSNEEKEEWDVRAAEDKERYLTEMADYTPPPGFDSKGNRIEEPPLNLPSPKKQKLTMGPSDIIVDAVSEHHGHHFPYSDVIHHQSHMEPMHSHHHHQNQHQQYQHHTSMHQPHDFHSLQQTSLTHHHQTASDNMSFQYHNTHPSSSDFLHGPVSSYNSTSSAHNNDFLSQLHFQPQHQHQDNSNNNIGHHNQQQQQQQQYCHNGFPMHHTYNL